MAEMFDLEDAFETEQQARAASRRLAVELIRQLKAKGFSEFTPAEKPRSPDIIWDEFNDCRVLVAWLPDWTSHPQAGKFACRVTTIAHRASGNNESGS